MWTPVRMNGTPDAIRSKDAPHRTNAVGRTVIGRRREYRGRAGNSRGAAKGHLLVFIGISLSLASPTRHSPYPGIYMYERRARGGFSPAVDSVPIINSIYFRLDRPYESDGGSGAVQTWPAADRLAKGQKLTGAKGHLMRLVDATPRRAHKVSTR